MNAFAGGFNSLQKKPAERDGYTFGRFSLRGYGNG